MSNRTSTTAFLFASISLAATSAMADNVHSINHGAAGHAPIGVMGDHRHQAGEFMLSYRYMRMDMSGNRSGTDSQSAEEVLADFVVTPLEMTTEMHMLGGMYAINEQVTLMAMLPYVSKEMDHRTRTDVEFTTQGSGLGDIKAGALIALNNEPASSGHINASISAPTGSTDERDDNPRCRMMDSCPSRLPYPMQIGSGTWDLIMGYTHRLRSGAWSGGGQANATLRLGRNDQDYSLGDELDASLWASRSINDAVSGSLRLAYRFWDDVDGSDDQLRNLPAQFIPTARPDLRGGQRADLGLGINVRLTGGHRIAAEYALPVWQNLHGPQLESDGVFTIGYQFSR